MKVILSIFNFLIPLLLEVVIICILILCAMSYEVWKNVLTPNQYPITEEIIFLILNKALITSVLLTVFFRISKSIFFYILKVIHTSFPEDSTDFKSVIVKYLLDIFILASLVLVIMPIRPILQDTIASESDFYITENFVRYDGMESALILFFLGAGVSIFILLWQRNKYGFFKIVFIIGIIVCSFFLNQRANFYARISETRAAWKDKEYELLIVKANKALTETDDKNEKALAYYWIGVGNNRLDRPTEAIKYQKMSIAIDPISGYQYSSISMAYGAIKDYKNASESAKLCIEKSSEYAWCYLGMFEYYLFSEVNIEKADEYLRKAEKYAPEDREIRQLRQVFEKEKKEILEIQRQGGIIVWE